MSRKNARELALHLVFEQCFQPNEIEETAKARLCEEEMQSIAKEAPLYTNEVTENDKRYITSVVSGIQECSPALDAIIEQYSKGWKLNRLSRITVAILRLALYEINHVADVPTGAAINEAVELAKRYASDDAASFINGILGSYVRDPNTSAQDADADAAGVDEHA